MKLNRNILAVLGGLACGVAAQAQMVTTFDWGFSTIFNPSVPPNSGITNEVSNPTAASVAAVINGDFNTYFFGMGPEGIYGTASGLWDIQNGSLDLAMSDRIGSPLSGFLVDYTIVLRQFVDAGGFYPGIVAFSVPGGQLIGSRTVEAQSGNMIGAWVEDTYKWSQVKLTEYLTLTITPGDPDPEKKSLLVDSVQLKIEGTLDKVPEPATLQLLVLGMAAAGLRAWSRRRNQ